MHLPALARSLVERLAPVVPPGVHLYAMGPAIRLEGRARAHGRIRRDVIAFGPLPLAAGYEAESTLRGFCIHVLARVQAFVAAVTGESWPPTSIPAEPDVEMRPLVIALANRTPNECVLTLGTISRI